MNNPLVDVLIIFILIMMNGFFSGSEIAIISLRKGRLKSLLENGDRRAQIIANLQSNPDSFFATVQIGVTLVGTFASVFGGARLVRHVAPIIEMIPLPYANRFSEDIALVFIVLGISYASLVLGELVPKSLALNYADRFAMVVARPLQVLSTLFSAFTSLLTVSSNLILRFFKDKTSFSESRLVTDEILHLLEEGVQSGSIERSEHEIIENVLEMNETAAREVMVPRVDVRALSVEISDEELRNIRFDYSRLPVYHESLDHIVGLVHVKDLIRTLARNEPVNLAKLVRPAYFVPDSMKIGVILKEMQKRKIHMAIVVDEFGGTAGVLTMEDILEEIVGEIQDEIEKPESEIVEQKDGSFLVSGTISISDFNTYFDSDIPEADSYTSIAGYVIQKLGRFPEVGEKIDDGIFSFELKKRIRQKMVEFKVIRISKEDGGDDSKNQNNS